MSQIAVIYWSGTGNTESMARAVEDGAKKAGAGTVLKTVSEISAAEAAVSVLTLQRSMLVSFGSMESEEILIMNILTGTAVWIFVLTLGFALIIKGIKKGSKVSCPEVRTKYHFK